MMCHRWGTMGLQATRMLSMSNPYIVLFNKLSTNLALVMGQSNCYRWCLLRTGSTCRPTSTLWNHYCYLLMCISLFCWSTSANIILLCLNQYSIIILILMLPLSMMWYNCIIIVYDYQRTVVYYWMFFFFRPSLWKFLKMHLVVVPFSICIFNTSWFTCILCTLASVAPLFLCQGFLGFGVHMHVV
jgi:hypothetical protein